MKQWLWVCPWIGLVGAIVAFGYFGFSFLSALGIAFLLACPAIGVWTWRESGRTFGQRDRMFERLTKGSGSSEEEPPKA